MPKGRYHAKIEKIIITGVTDLRPRYQLTIKLFGLSFLTLNALPKGHVLFVPSQFIAYFIVFIYFLYIQQAVFGTIKGLLYIIGDKGLKMLSDATLGGIN